MNLASRLEHEAAPGSVLISYETFANVKDEILCEEKGRIRVKGIAYPVATYRVIGVRDEGADPPIRADLPHLRLEAEPASMTPDERERAATALRDALARLTGNRP